MKLKEVMAALRAKGSEQIRRILMKHGAPDSLLGVRIGDMKPIVRASFIYRGQHYKLDVTDPEYERTCLERGVGEYQIPSVVACISLSEPYTAQNGDTFAYKLMASIITRERAGG